MAVLTPRGASLECSVEGRALVSDASGGGWPRGAVSHICTYQEGRTASRLSSPSHRTMSYPSERSLAPGLRWLAGSPPELETWLWASGKGAGWGGRELGWGVRSAGGLGTHPHLQSEPRGTDPCSVDARRGPPWPGLWRPVPPLARRQAPALRPCLRPDPPPEVSLTPPHTPRLVWSRLCP